jgi:hypothetical protein
MPVRFFWRLFAIFAVAGALSFEARPADLIFLDPICRPGEARRPSLPPGNPAPSTLKMAALLETFSSGTNAVKNSFLSDQLANSISNNLLRNISLGQRVGLEFNLAMQQMNAGRPDFALNSFSRMESLMKADGGTFDSKAEIQLRMRKGIAFLRLGEQENCIAQHNAESCLFPLRPKAYHLLPRGARGAMALFTEQLEKNPADPAARWLLNISYMTLGEYPDGVPAKYLIPPKTFASEYEMPRFTDVADKLGLNIEALAGGIVVDDFNNDGYLDIVKTAWDLRGQMQFFVNNRDGTFTERTSEAGLVGEVSGLNIQQTDYNNDGWLDLFIPRGAWLGNAGRMPASLLRNNGNGTFTDVTEEAGLLRMRPTQAVEWFDYDGDGWLDLFIGNETTDPAQPEFCELFRNNQNGTFTECARESGIAVARFIKGVTSADYDGDGRPDLFLSNRAGSSFLFRNEGPQPDGKWKFKDVSKAAGIADPKASFSTWFFDYDNDGKEDIFLAGYQLKHGVADIAADYMGLPHQGTLARLFHNNGDGTFSDVTADARLNRIIHTMGCNYGDIDNDGWLDFYSATGDPDLSTLIPNRLFRNADGKFFQDVTTATGTGHLQKGHGVAIADIDNDGAPDIHVVMGGAYPGDTARTAIFQNPGTTNGWLKLKLIGTKANRAAIGATLAVNIVENGKARTLHRRISHGASFGANPLRAEIGLGQATVIRDVEIRWPGSNTRQTIRGLELNRAYEIHEDNEKPIALDLNRLPINAKPGEKPKIQANRD